MKANFYDPSSTISINGFLASFKLVRDTNNIHESTAIWVLHFSVEPASSTTLDSASFDAAHINPAVPSIKTTDPVIQMKLLQSYWRLLIMFSRSL